MSAASQRFPITVEQYEQFEGYPGLRDELINGRIVMSPQPKPLHQEITRNIELALSASVKGSPFVARQNSNIKLAQLNSMPAPDVFVVRADEWFEACQTEAYLSTPPVIAVEVLSPANRRTRVAEKVDIYLTAGVLAVWVVDPKRQSVQVHAKRALAAYQVGDPLISIPLHPPLEGAVALDDIFRLRRQP